LLLDKQANKYRALDNWFMTPQGMRVASAFTDELSAIEEQCTGDSLIQLGSCGENRWLSQLKFRHKWLIDPCMISRKTSLISSLNTLPIDRDSIDCVIAPLTMETFARDKNPIDEIDRILKPMGYAIFLGINPVSFWGAAAYWRQIACFGTSKPNLTSSLTLKRMMMQRGYRQCALSSFYYIPPVTKEYLINKLTFLNEMGKMIWPFPAGFYCFIVQKYQYCSPSLVLDATGELPMQRKSSLQALGKCMHDNE
jgi:hypothetical protein